MKTGSRAVLVGLLISAISCTPEASENEGAPPAVPLTQTGDTQWRYPASATTHGLGVCAGITVGEFLDAVRARFEQLGDIQAFRSSGPGGPTMVAGPAARAGEQAPAPTERLAYVTGLMSTNALGAIFVRGDRCRGDACEQREFWYFDTDDRCEPRSAGHYQIVEHPGAGRLGNCFDVTGEPRWGFPSGATDARYRCDADWSPQDISGSVNAWSLTGAATCGAGKGLLPVQLNVEQEPDRTVASVVLSGTGLSSIDGRPFTGKVERKRFLAALEETTSIGCPVRRKITFNLDFEAPSVHGIPGGIGLVDIREVPAGPCSDPAPTCSTSFHLARQ